MGTMMGMGLGVGFLYASHVFDALDRCFAV